VACPEVIGHLSETIEQHSLEKYEMELGMCKERAFAWNKVKIYVANIINKW